MWRGNRSYQRVEAKHCPKSTKQAKYITLPIHNIKINIAIDEVSDSSLADLLKDASREEILDALKTVELDCIKHKDSLDHLFGLIIGHTPELLSVMAEVQQPDR